MFAFLTILILALVSLVLFGVIEIHRLDWGGIIGLIVYGIIIGAACGISDSNNTIDLYNLKMAHDVAIPNSLTQARMVSHNSLVLTNSHSIVDLPNASQSTENSQQYENLANQVAGYNATLTLYIYRNEHPFLSFLSWGICPRVSGLDYIKLSEVK